VARLGFFSNFAALSAVFVSFAALEAVWVWVRPRDWGKILSAGLFLSVPLNGKYISLYG